MIIDDVMCLTVLKGVLQFFWRVWEESVVVKKKAIANSRKNKLVLERECNIIYYLAHS